MHISCDICRYHCVFSEYIRFSSFFYFIFLMYIGKIENLSEKHISAHTTIALWPIDDDSNCESLHALMHITRQNISIGVLVWLLVSGEYALPFIFVVYTFQFPFVWMYVCVCVCYQWTNTITHNGWKWLRSRDSYDIVHFAFILKIDTCSVVAYCG